MKAKKLNRSTLLLIFVAVVLLTVNVLLGIFLTRQSGIALISSIRSRMLDISNTAAAMLDGDTLASLKAEDENTPEYQQVMKTLRYFQENIDLKYIYCITDAGGGNFVFSVDPTVEDPGEFGSPIVYTDALYQASLGIPSVDEKPYEDAWGRFYSSYSPVFKSNGTVGAIVAVDFGADWYDRQVSDLFRIVIMFGVLSLIIGITMVLFFNRRDRRKYRDLYAQLNNLAAKVEELALEIGAESALSVPEDNQIGEDSDALGKKILSIQKDLRNYIETVHKQAYIDALTGIGNKTAYLEMKHRIEKSVGEGNARFSVAVFDLNGLKVINDNFGHESGDVILSDTAKMLSQVFSRDSLYRIGGDEFIAILRNTSEKEIELMFKSIDNTITGYNMIQHKMAFPLAISKGYAVFDPDNGDDYNSVFRRADNAMYEDKRRFYEENAGLRNWKQSASSSNSR